MKVDPEALQGGACQALPPEVVDKYFLSNGLTERFERMTAQAICAGCVVQLACLADAIANPSRNGVRGGETAESIRALNYQHRQERTPVTVLARTAIRHQLQPLRGAYGHPKMRAGRFTPVELAYPELGGGNA